MGEGVYSHAIFGRIRKHSLYRSRSIRFPTGYRFYETINYIFEYSTSLLTYPIYH